MRIYNIITLNISKIIFIYAVLVLFVISRPLRGQQECVVVREGCTTTHHHTHKLIGGGERLLLHKMQNGPTPKP